MLAELLADVAVRATIPGVEAVFTYRVPARLRTPLKNVLHGLCDGFRNLEPAMSLQALHGADL